jgi:O-antigen/teichoic acid export membrane protein
MSSSVFWRTTRDRLHRLLPQSRFWRRLTALAGATALGQAVMVAAMPLLTRLYAPADFGASVVFIMLLALMNFAMGLRYEAAIPLCETDDDAAVVTQLVMVIALLLGFGLVLLLALADGAIADLLNLADHVRLLWWLPLVFFLEGVFLAFHGWALYQGVMRALALSRIAQWVTIAAAQVLLGFASDGNPHALIIGYLMGQIAAVLVIVAHLSAEQRALFSALHGRRMRALAQRFKRFPLYGSWAMLLNSAAVLLPPILASAVFGLAAGGHYGLAQRTVGIPVRFLGISAAQVYTAEISRLGYHDRAEIARLFNDTVRRLFLIGAAYLVVLAIVGPWLFTIVFGEAWRESGVIARLLVPMYLASFVYQPVQYTLQYFERQDLILIVNGYSLMVVIGLFWAANHGLLEMRTTILAMSIGLTFSYLISFYLARQLVLGRLPAGRPSMDAGSKGHGPQG